MNIKDIKDIKERTEKRNELIRTITGKQLSGKTASVFFQERNGRLGECMKWHLLESAVRESGSEELKARVNDLSDWKV
jgi:hypothetical protein